MKKYVAQRIRVQRAIAPTHPGLLTLHKNLGAPYFPPTMVKTNTSDTTIIAETEEKHPSFDIFAQCHSHPAGGTDTP